MSKRSAPLWGGRALRHWLLAGARPERPSQLLSGWRSRLFDICHALSAGLPEPAPIAEPPIFILGFWRSGTTLLHRMLAALPGHHAPGNWQCLHPATFRLTAPPRTKPSIRRPMDAVTVSPTSPEEDEFALLLLGLPSLYRGFLDPRRLSELATLLEGSDGDSWVEPWLRFSAGVAAGNPGRLVVKSPNHLFRLASLRQHFPAAPLLVTLRDAQELYWSNCRLWEAMVGEHGLAAPPAGAIEGFVGSAMQWAAHRIDALAEARLAGAPVAACRFADLVADPARTSADLAARAGLTVNADALVALQAAAAANTGIAPQTRGVPVPAHTRATVAALDRAGERLLAAG